MKIFTFNFLKQLLLIVLAFALSKSGSSQSIDSLVKRIPTDTGSYLLNMDAAYNRPFLSMDKLPVTVGGYLEANTFYGSEDGISEGLSFQARRLTLFFSSSIAKRIKFLSEIEFEDGTKEIGIEFAAMDITFNPLLNFRGGIIMNPIGAFNQNHDGPKWEFVERPTVTVDMLPATWSNAGFGIYGKTYKKNWVFGYEAYLTNGFDGSIIDNKQNKTFLPSTKDNEERFEESSNGEPMFSAKTAIKNRKLGEIGISYMGGIYNKYINDGVNLDKKRRVDVYALDFNTTLQKTGTYIVGEAVLINVDVPSTYTQQYGNKQWGVFIDVVQPVIQRKMFDWEKASLNIAARLDYTDWNVGTFNETGTNIGDEALAITPAVSFRPSQQTVLRLNYRYQWYSDILQNPTSLSAAWLFGFSTYF